MSAADRTPSRNRGDSTVRHSHSWSESGRASVPVPMWDSADPVRAPPPLPLNPGTNSPTTKANTSAGIAAAAKQIVDRARESAPLSSYTTNKETPQGSPERSLVRGQQHRRMQSFQSGNVKDLKNYLDSKSPEKSPERPTSRSGAPALSRVDSREEVSTPLERTSTPTPSARDPLKGTPQLRPSSRPGPRPLLGENTPPSATMLALQTMQVPDQPLNDITNGPGSPSPVRPSTGHGGHGHDEFSNQISNLTSIATNLQREMASLSRRSKDNATDLLGLKDATNQRDEDIRKSLRELANNSNNSMAGLLGPPPVIGGGTRSASNFSNFLDSKPWNSPPAGGRSYSVPRAASAQGYLDERVGSPSPYSVEGAASVAMLEKIIREMVTKEGQERLQTSLSELLEKSRTENGEAARKVEELSQFIKEKSESQALIPMPMEGPPKLELNFDSPGAARGEGGEGLSSSEELLGLLQRIKDSVAHTGGSTGEVKNLVRDLRGEVLGMGRELGRKLDQVSETQLNTTLDRSIEDGQGSQNAEEVQRIIEEGMLELKEHMSGMMRQRADEDDHAFKQLASARGGPDGEEMFAAIKHALAEHSHSLAKPDAGAENAGVDREGVLEAVKEGLKDFEPNIELQQFGLERDEILTVLKEGLEDYQNNRAHPAPASIDKGEVYEAMQEAMKDFQAPMPNEQIALMKEELLTSIRQSLEDYKPAPSGQTMNDEGTRTAVIEAVKEGLANHGPDAPREIEISRDDLFDAVKASLDGSAIPFGGFGEQVLSQMNELIDGMRLEFKQYSAANGRDTEQVLDAVKDGLESLRGEIETYVDRSQDVTGKDEIVDTVKGGLEQLRADVQGYVSEGPTTDSGKGEMLDYIKSEFEHLHAAIASQESARGSDDEPKADHTAAIILAIKEGMDELKTQVGTSRSGEDEPSEEMLEAMKEEFEQLKASVLNANAHDKSELIETIQDSMGALHAKFNGSELGSGLSGGATEEVIQELHVEFSNLKEQLQAIVGDGDREAIISGVKQSIDDLRTQLSADQSDASAEALGAIKEELDRFKESMGSSLVLGGASNETSDETLKAVQAGIDDIKENMGKRNTDPMSDEMLEAIRGEFENLRNSIGTSVVASGSNEEVLDAVRLGLDDLTSHIDRKLDNPEQGTSQHGELLDAINEGLETLRTDVVKTLDKPLDMTVNYEILDTLKDGLAGLRSDMDKLKESNEPSAPKSGEVVLAEPGDVGETREVPDAAAAAAPAAAAAAASNGVNRADFEKMEVLLAQLQIKIEAMDATVQDMPAPKAEPAQPAEGTAMKDDLVGMEAMLKEIQESVAVVAAKEQTPPGENAATKEDTDAIETLLRNTKAHLEEMANPDTANAATKDQLESLEAIVRVTNEAMDGLNEKLDNTTAAKGDVAVVEVLAQDVKTALEELKEKMSKDSDEKKPDLMTKADMDVLGLMCTEIKERVNEIQFPDPTEAPSKADIEQLQGLINDFRESHDKMRDSYETDIAVTAKAFDDRKKEFEDTVQEISDVKNSITEIKDELLSKMGDSETDLNTLGETLKSLEEKTSNEPVSAELKELAEKVTQEFERSHGSLEAMKVEYQQASETSLEKQAENKGAMVEEIGAKLETYFDGLMTKYDDAQRAAEEKAKGMEDRSSQQEELLTGTKSMADDLRLSIDTLGGTLTTFASTFPEQMDKMAEESKTVFTKVEDTYNKLDETQEGLKYEHSLTRDEVGKVMSAVEMMQADTSEHNPRFMVTLKEVQALVGQHYEHSQKASDAAAEHTQAVKELQEQMRGLGTQNEEMRTNITSLPAMLPAPEAPAPPTEKYDDTAVQDKLDKLMGHATEAKESSAQLERLDEIHEKVMSTAAEVSAFVATQTRQITADHENKEKEAEELALLLERRQVQKDEIETDITVLNSEKDGLHNTVEALKAEKDALTSQKSRLAADVSSLETAMHIRREELHEMDRRAEAIERRMLEGVMNQSRMLLLAKTSPPKSPKKNPKTGGQARDLRVPSSASSSAQTVTSSLPPSSALIKGHALAMKSRPGMQRQHAGGNGAAAANSGAQRRIMSLNEINNNVGAGSARSGSPAASLLSSAASGQGGIKRSQSVRTAAGGGARKGSWGGKRDLTLPSSGQDKENDILSEADEDREEEESRYDELSDAGTERRTSYTESGLGYTDGTGSVLTYDEGVTPGTERRTSLGRSEASYETGSYLTGTDIDERRESVGGSSAGGRSSEGGVLGVSSAIDEEPGRESDEEDEEPTQLAISAGKGDGVPEGKEEKGVFAPPSDSGLGTDLPTAALGSEGGSVDYFKEK